MAGKDWFGGWAVLASFAAIAGATLLTGKSRSRVESSDKRLKLAHGFFVEANLELDKAVRNASNALDRYAQLANRRDVFEKDTSGRSEQEIADARKGFSESLESLKEEFQDLDRAADLAYRWREEAAYELDMARRGPEAEYPIGYEFSESFEESYGGMDSQDRERDILHSKGLRGHAHREAQKMKAKGGLRDPADYIEIEGEPYDADAVHAAVSILRNVYGSDLQGEKFGSPQYLEYLRSVLMYEGRKKTAEEIWSDYGFAPESEKTVSLRRMAVSPVESVLDPIAAGLRSQAARAKARKRSDRYRNPVRPEDVLYQTAPVAELKPSPTTAKVVRGKAAHLPSSSAPNPAYEEAIKSIEKLDESIRQKKDTSSETKFAFNGQVLKLVHALRKDRQQAYIDRLAKIGVDIKDKKYDLLGVKS